QDREKDVLGPIGGLRLSARRFLFDSPQLGSLAGRRLGGQQARARLPFVERALKLVDLGDWTRGGSAAGRARTTPERARERSDRRRDPLAQEVREPQRETDEREASDDERA